MCCIPFSFKVCCISSTDRVWLYAIQIVCRLSLSPLVDIASMMLSKQAGEEIQSVFLSKSQLFPHNWKFMVLVLYLRVDPKSSAVEQWMSQLSKIRVSVFRLSLTILSNSASLNSKRYKYTSSVVALIILGSDRK